MFFDRNNVDDKFRHTCYNNYNDNFDNNKQ